MNNNNEMLARTEERGLPPEMMDPNWNLLDRLSPYDQACYMHHQRHRLNHLKALRLHHADDQHVLLLDEAGLLSAVGVPVPTREQLQRPPPELIYGKRAEEMRIEGYTARLAKRVLGVLDGHYFMRHPAWETLRAVNEAIREEIDVWDIFPAFHATVDVLHATETPIDEILKGICLAVGYRTDEEDDRLELLMGFCQVLGDMVEEFHDMYQRLVAHVAENGTDKTKIVKWKLERLETAWEKILEMLTREALAQEMGQILQFWEDFSGYTTEGGDVSSPRPQTVNNPNVELVQAGRHTSPLFEPIILLVPDE
ncbi:hypothetical protein CCMA1212_010182 [Trichoderma ghanense]|uniref:Uncharacterized protein n=1 Tax=Trichoderma ghanense TaxID=65468 RepID=A0ABY2GQ21_9HYPO